MTTQRIIYDEVSTTQRRTFLGGATEQEHRDMLAQGFVKDKFANQYRRTVREHTTFVDGVASETVASDKAA